MFILDVQLRSTKISFMREGVGDQAQNGGPWPPMPHLLEPPCLYVYLLKSVRCNINVDLPEFDRNSYHLMTTENSNLSTFLEPMTSPPPSAAVIGDNDDRNGVTVTSPSDDNSTKKKTRVKRRSSRKSEEIDEVTEQPVDKGFHFSV